MRKAGTAVVLAISLFLFLLENCAAQDVTTSKVPKFSSGYETYERGKSGQLYDGNHNRVSRSPPLSNSMEDKLKEFASKLGKTPDDLRAAFGKFMLAQGISVQHMQEEIERGHEVALQMVDSIKKAMHV